MRPKLTVIDGTATTCIVEADSPMFGANELEFPLNEQEMLDRIHRWKNQNMMVQQVFGDLSPVHREFLLSGMPVSEQESLFGSHEDEADDWDEEDPES